MVCQSGRKAKPVIQSIADASTPVYIDLIAHASLWEGVLSAGATARPFRAQRFPVAGEDGTPVRAGRCHRRCHLQQPWSSLSPYTKWCDVATRRGCVIVVDRVPFGGCFWKARGRSHARAWAVRSSSLPNRQPVEGVRRAGRRDSRNARSLEYFRCEARPSIFSSAVFPHEAAGDRATLDLVQRRWAARATPRQRELRPVGLFGPGVQFPKRPVPNRLVDCRHRGANGRFARCVASARCVRSPVRLSGIAQGSRAGPVHDFRRGTRASSSINSSRSAPRSETKSSWKTGLPPESFLP